MRLGYIRISKTDESLNPDLQKDTLLEIGIGLENIYEYLASGKTDDRSSLNRHHLRHGAEIRA